jgi:hypothetical protein
MSQNRTLLSKIVTLFFWLSAVFIEIYGPDLAKSRHALLIGAPRFPLYRKCVFVVSKSRQGSILAWRDLVWQNFGFSSFCTPE